MGFFRDVGERVERFKQTVEDVAEDEAEYECRECGAAIYAEREDCPECGAAAVVPRDPDVEGDPANGDGIEGDPANGDGETEGKDEGIEDDARTD